MIAQQFRAARRVGTPLVAINTPDPAATIASIEAVLVNGAAPPILRWDVVTGLAGYNETGVGAAIAIVQALGGEIEATMGLPGLIAVLNDDKAQEALPQDSIIFVLNAQRLLSDPQTGADAGVAQAIWNVRDVYKGEDAANTLVLLSPGIQLPPDLAPDVLVLDEPLPTPEDLGEIVDTIWRDAMTGDDGKTARLTKNARTRAVDAMQGLAAFPAEQALSMSMSPDGLDHEALWERKRTMIEGTPGLSIWRGDEAFDGVGGYDNIKGFLRRVLNGAARPKAVVFIDEIEKAVAGAGTDTTGVSQDYLGQLLAYMQDNESTGVIFVGPPGSAKSMVAKAAGNEGAIPTIQLDLGGMKGSFVGQSEQTLRQGFKVITAVGARDVLFVATSNWLAQLPAALRRRFNFGTFYFDLPTDDERTVIWEIYRKKYNLWTGDQPDDEGWTGAEIKTCVDLAWRLGCDLKEAASYIVPVAVSAKEDIARLRTEATGRFISASYPGTYKIPPAATGATKTAHRARRPQ